MYLGEPLLWFTRLMLCKRYEDEIGLTFRHLPLDLPFEWIHAYLDACTVVSYQVGTLSTR